MVLFDDYPQTAVLHDESSTLDIEVQERVIFACIAFSFCFAWTSQFESDSVIHADGTSAIVIASVWSLSQLESHKDISCDPNYW